MRKWLKPLIFVKNNIKFYLANNFKLAIKLDLDGVYISAYNNSLRHNNYLLKSKFKILGSAHNQFEINCKKNQKIEELFISPIFKKRQNTLRFMQSTRFNKIV